MCAVCGCLTTTQPAPEDGTDKCMECEEAGSSETVAMKQGDMMPSCSNCGETKVHWVKV